MQTTKVACMTIAVILAGSMLLISCDPGPNTQPGPLDLSVNTEDGSGDDAKITTAVHTMLMKDLQLKHLSIEVETRKGDVRLFGEVETEAQRMHAELVVAAVSGVHAVNNQLLIKQ